MTFKSKREAELKNLRPLLAYLLTFRQYPATRITVAYMYSMLNGGDPVQKEKAKEFFKYFIDYFEGFIPHDTDGVPYQPNYADSFGDWFGRVMKKKDDQLMNSMSKFGILDIN